MGNGLTILREVLGGPFVPESYYTSYVTRVPGHIIYENII